MATKPGPGTCLPTPDEPTASVTSRINKSRNRQTKFPGGIGLQPLSTPVDKSLAHSVPGTEPTIRAPSRIPLAIRLADSLPSKPVPVMSIQKEGKEPPHIHIESPWSVYEALHSLERGGTVTAACSKKVPVKMVAVKRVSPHQFEEISRCQNENLLAILEAFSFENSLFIITDYTAATLKQVIAAPIPLEERHISATCRQGSSCYHSLFTALTLSKVFEGVNHLSRFGLAHQALDSSKVLFSSDGCAKIGK
jgi:hypothetical protein